MSKNVNDFCVTINTAEISEHAKNVITNQFTLHNIDSKAVSLMQNFEELIQLTEIKLPAGDYVKFRDFMKEFF